MQHIDSVFEAQQAHKYTLRTSNATQRINKLKALKACIEENESMIYQALQQDLRKSVFEAAATEVIFIYAEIGFAIKNLSSWMKPASVRSSMSNLMAKNRIYTEPKGVCLIIAPWNYPFQLLMSPLISAIAAGNCAMLKPSELSPSVSAVITKLISSCFEEKEICCVEGDASLARELLKLPFDHIFFTGSTAIGKLVMEAAAKNLSSVTLELGGKSPVVIDSTADLKKAAKKIAWGKLINAGQTCIAPDYILLPKASEAAFIDYYKAEVELLFFKDKVPDPAVYVKIINEHHFNRISNLMDDAIRKGAVLSFGGETDPQTLTINPAVLANVPDDAAVMQEEIFGPVLPIITYLNITDAIQKINQKEKPLALYIFSNDDGNIHQIIKNTSSGGTCVNDVLIHIANPRLPFGGTNASGMGSCHGQYGFKAFSHERSVLFQSKLDFTSLIYPPYKEKNWMLKWLKKLM